MREAAGWLALSERQVRIDLGYGNGVVAVQEHPDLRQLSDPERFAAAQDDGRVVVPRT